MPNRDRGDDLRLGRTLTRWKTVDHLAGWDRLADVLHADDPDLAHVLAGAAVDHHGWALEADQAFWAPTTHTDPEAALVLTLLRERGFKLGVLSSTIWPRAWHQDWLRRDGVLDLFDACVWSSDLPWTKPHPAAFRAAMDAVGVTEPVADLADLIADW